MAINSATNTIVGVFADERTARQVVDDLIDQGFSREQVHLRSQRDWTIDAATGGSKLTGTAPTHEGGFMHWLENLFGSDTPEEERGQYANSVQRGNCLVAVEADRNQQEDAVEIMNRYNALNIDEQGSHIQGQSIANTETSKAVPVINEELQVGKRVVQRGGVRVYSKQVEEPVEEQVQLRDEKVRVERRPVNREVTPADMEALRDQTIEVLETTEEPVINKTRRVVEEVRVGKEATERTETIRDTVRRSQVEVEQLGAQNTSQNVTGDWRDDFNARYAGTGGTYETYSPAYDYGYRMANDPRYQGQDFEDVEDTLKTDYLRSNPNSNWDQMRGAVRYGWERITGKR